MGGRRIQGCGGLPALKTAFISNGNATPEVLDYIRPWTDCYKIDLKAMDDKRYRELGGVLQHVVDAIRMVHERGFWLEIVTLIVPGFNDDEGQLTRAAELIASVSPEIPWHVHGVPQGLQDDGPRKTPQPRHCCAPAKSAAPGGGCGSCTRGISRGRVGRWEHTYCPDCGDLLIERRGYVIKQQARRSGTGAVPPAAGGFPGIWS